MGRHYRLQIPNAIGDEPSELRTSNGGLIKFFYEADSRNHRHVVKMAITESTKNGGLVAADIYVHKHKATEKLEVLSEDGSAVSSLAFKIHDPNHHSLIHRAMGFCEKVRDGSYNISHSRLQPNVSYASG